MKIDLDPNGGGNSQTSLNPVTELPRLLTALFDAVNNVSYVDPAEGQSHLNNMLAQIDVSPERRAKIEQIITAQPVQNLEKNLL